MANTHSLDLELGSTQYADISNASQTGLNLTGDFTVEFWFKPESIGINQAIVSKFSAASGNFSYRINFSDSEEVSVFLSEDGTADNRDLYTSSAGGHITAGVWAHFAIAYDLSGNDVTVYKNGVAIAGATATTGTMTGIYDGTADFNIGASGSGTEFYLDGLVDDVRVWSDIRTPTEILDNMKFELNGDEAGLVGYWKLNNNYLDATSNDNDLTASGSPVFSTNLPEWLLTDNGVAYYKLDALSDEIASYDLTNTNSVTFDTGLMGDCADFGTANSNKDLRYTADNLGIDGGAITMSIWVKIRTEPDASPDFGLIEQSSTSSDTGYHIQYLYGGGTPYVQFNRARDGVENKPIPHTITLGTSSWHHLVLTYDGATLEGYVNGASVGSIAATGNGTSNPDGGLYIGQTPAFAGFYSSAYIDEVGVWDRALRADEVIDLYNSGNGLSYPFTGLDAGLGTFTLTGNAVTFRNYTSVALDAGSYTLTGNSLTFQYSGWTPVSKNSASWTDVSKNAASWTDASKNSASWTDTSKNSASWTDTSKNSATWTDVSK